MFHGVLFGLLVLTLVGSLVNLYRSLGDHQRIYSASLIAVLAICAILLSLICRVYALKAQDRAIRAEENLRHFVLTGKLLDPKLTMGQIIALRFAADAEFVALAQEAAAKNLPPDDIKRSIRNWRADPYRV